MNIKFPKEETRVLEIVRNALLKKDYKVLLEQYDNVFNYSMFINQYNEFIINSYVEALFKIKEYDKLLNLVEHLRSKDMESCNWYFYCLMYLLSNKDLFYAKSIISRSKILKDPSLNCYITEEESNYNMVFNLHYDLLITVGPCLILINFINELMIEVMNKKFDDEYMIMRLFDLLNLMYEYGVDDKVIDTFRIAIESLYEIEIL